MSHFSGGLTVITEPTPFFNPYGYWGNINRALPRRLWRWLARFSVQAPTGHAAVTRSLLHGLRRLEYPYNYNPPLQSSIASHSLVLSSVDALSQALLLKRAGKIKCIFAGPNIVTLPNEAGGIIAAQEINACIVPSNWVRDLYVSCCPSLAGRIIVWAAGVDTERWKPVSQKKASSHSPKILIYVKGGGGVDMLPGITRWLECVHISARKIEYGSYTESDYKNSLDWADLMIVLGGTESQGIAMAEAWSMNVPTLVRSKMTWRAPDGGGFQASASPYLSEWTGAFFSEEEELFFLIDRWRSSEVGFAPRSWVLENMSDEICAKNLLRLIDERK